MRLWISSTERWPKRPRLVVTVTYRGKANGRGAVVRGIRALYGKRRIPIRGPRIRAHRVGERAMRKYSVWNGLVSIERNARSARRGGNPASTVVWMAYVFDFPPYDVEDPQRIRVVRA